MFLYLVNKSARPIFHYQTLSRTVTFLGSIPAAMFLLGGSFTSAPIPEMSMQFTYMVKTCFFLFPCPFPLFIQNNFGNVWGKGELS